VTLLCGDDVLSSRTLQVAVLTAARIAKRCFPGAVRAVLPAALATAPLRIWAREELLFVEAVAGILGTDAVSASGNLGGGSTIVFGRVAAPGNAVRATFDGWIAAAGPMGSTPQMQEREHCSLAGILSAALAMSEVFMAFAGTTLQAGRRTVSLSLWRPDLSATDPGALGPVVAFLPREAWVLGLGHLGNAYLWALSTLPYPDPREVCFSLNDFDKVEGTNLETGVLFEPGDEGHLKTRILDRWVRAHGFETRLLERRFDEHFRRQRAEPQLAFCGFDSNPARRHLETAGFDRAIESGLGGKASNFDTINLHTFPSARTALDLWPDLEPHEAEKEFARQEKMARENPGYGALSKDECGRIDLAGKSIAVPFVGVAASALVVAESLRLLHDGPAYEQVKLSLAAPDRRACNLAGEYSAQDAAGIPFVMAA